ncbi:unnamed protein product, partial [Sphacelaria rigidula]
KTQLHASLEALARVLRREKRESEKQRQQQRKAIAKAEERTAAAMKAAGAAEAAAAAAMASVAGVSAEGDGGGGGAPRALMSVDEALDRAEALKKRANMVLTDTRYPEAVEQYTLGIKVLEPHVSPAPSALINASEDDGSKSGREKAGDEGKEEAKAGSGGDADEEDVVEDEQKVAARELMLILLCNRSLAHLKWGNLGSAKEDAQHAMDLDPHHIKAYFRRAAAHKQQAERYREALSDLRYMLRLEPPPVKGAAVSDDILAVQKMARECEQKVREVGFRKALQESSKNTKPVLPVSVRKE